MSQQYDKANKIKFAMGVPVSITIKSWEQGKYGLTYHTTDGRFFDPSKGLTDVLGEMNLSPNAQVTIEKRPNPNVQVGQTDYGKFYVNNMAIEDLSNGVPVAPTTTNAHQQQQGTPPPPPQTGIAPPLSLIHI